MKLIYHYLLRKLFVSKRLYIWLFLLLGIGFKLTSSAVGNSLQQPLELLINVYYKLSSGIMMDAFIIPCFLFLLGIISNTFDRYQILLKYKSAKHWWKDRSITVFMFVALYTLTIHIIILGTLVVIGGINYITSDIVSFLLLSISMYLVGLMMIGIFAQIITLLTNSYLGFFITILFLLLMKTANSVFKLQLYTIPDYMTLVYKSETGIVSIQVTDIIVLFCFLLATLTLYYIGSTLSKEKDYYWSG